MRTVGDFSKRYRTFFLTPTDRVQVSLRRWEPAGAQHGYCNARPVYIADAPSTDWGTFMRGSPTFYPYLERLDTIDRALYPTQCETCGRTFSDQARFDPWAQMLHTGAPDGQLYTLDTAPIGAMWDASWYPPGRPYAGPDGMHLMVVLPNLHEWHVDGRASNCELPNDDAHYCWVRHGDPRTEPVTVDKRGQTCKAGAGSIQSGSYHGFLKQGYLQP